MNRLALVNLFFLSLFYPVILFAGQGNSFLFENMSIADGLPHNTVQYIFQDGEGYMWFATKDGVCRYDGSRYIVYREGGKEKTLSNSKVRCIAEDKNGMIWVGTDNGLNRIDPVKQQVVSFVTALCPELLNNKINSLFFDPEEEVLWIATESGVSLYDTGRDAFFVSPQIVLNKAVCTVGGLLNGEIYAGTQDGLYFYNKRGKTISRIALRENDAAYAVFTVFEDSEGSVWVGNNRGLLGKLNRAEGTLSVIHPAGLTMSDDYSICSIVEKDQMLWLVSKRKGVFLFNRQQEKLSDKKGFYPVTLPGNTEKILLTNACKDTNGTIWIGSYYLGVFYYSEYINQFSRIEIERPGQSSTGIIGPILEDGEGFWLGSADVGITYYNRVTQKQEFYGIVADGVSLSECKPLFIKDGVLWVGTDSHGIYLFDTSAKKVIQHYRASLESLLPGNRINTGFKDSGGRLWFGYNGGRGGLCRFDERSQTFRTLLPADENIVVRDIYYICQATPEELWIGTRNNGLFRYNIPAEVFTPVPVMGRQDVSVSYIFEDSRKQVWVGTFGQGLICMDTMGEVIDSYNYNSSGINNNICGIVEDNSGRIWISSFDEIAYYDTEHDKFVRYDIDNNFLLRHVKPMSCLFSGEGLLYFGGSNGLMEANPLSLMRINEVPPRVVLTDFLVHSKPVDEHIRESVMRHRFVKLKYNQQNLTFSFAALNYIHPEKNQYLYKLEGLDKDWNRIPKQQEITYNNLGAGEYRLLVRAANNSEVWSEPTSLLTILITPAPWLTWWAYLIYTIVVVGVLGLFYYYKRAKIYLEHNLKLKQLEKSNLEKMHKFRLDLFTNFSHEIRTPLTLIAASVDELQNQSSPESPGKGTLTGIERNVDKITRLVNQLLDFRKHDEGRMDLQASEQLFIPFVRDILSGFAELSSLKNHPIQVTLPDDEELVLWYDPYLLEQVFTNLLMNAFKYSREGSRIELRVEKTDPQQGLYRGKVAKDITEAVLVSVFNEGEPVPEDKLEKLFEPFYRLKQQTHIQGTGIGLSLNRMIMRMHHSDIWAENVPGEGIVFRFLIPAGNTLPAPTWIEEPLDADISDTSEVVREEQRTLLLVEDNEEIRYYLKSKLRTLYTVFDSPDGGEALAILEEKSIDLVISDIMMPVMDGLELCRSIKSNMHTNHIPVILLTARTSDTHIKEGLYCGANEYIPKPFKFDLLLARVQNLLENNERLRLSFQKKINPEELNVQVTNYDEEFLRKCYDYLQKNMTDPELTIEDFGREVGLSRVHLYRKLKYLTNLSPSQFILSVRLKVAADLLQQENVAVSDVCYQVGFNNLSYFTRSFKQQYGVSPSAYRNSCSG